MGQIFVQNQPLPQIHSYQSRKVFHLAQHFQKPEQKIVAYKQGYELFEGEVYPETDAPEIIILHRRNEQ